MRECPYSPGIDANACRKCHDTCGFVPSEVIRRKNMIDKGAGLSENDKGQKHLKIKRSE